MLRGCFGLAQTIIGTVTSRLGQCPQLHATLSNLSLAVLRICFIGLYTVNSPKQPVSLLVDCIMHPYRLNGLVNTLDHYLGYSLAKIQLQQHFLKQYLGNYFGALDKWLMLACTLPCTCFSQCFIGLYTVNSPKQPASLLVSCILHPFRPNGLDSIFRLSNRHDAHRVGQTAISLYRFYMPGKSLLHYCETAQLVLHYSKFIILANTYMQLQQYLAQTIPFCLRQYLDHYLNYSLAKIQLQQHFLRSLLKLLLGKSII